jgi:hypothetical protein
MWTSFLSISVDAAERLALQHMRPWIMKFLSLGVLFLLGALLLLVAGCGPV